MVFALLYKWGIRRLRLHTRRNESHRGGCNEKRMNQLVDPKNGPMATPPSRTMEKITISIED